MLLQRNHTSASYKCKKEFIGKMLVKYPYFCMWNAPPNLCCLKVLTPRLSFALSLSHSLFLSLSHHKWCFLSYEMITHNNCFIFEHMCSGCNIPDDLRSSHTGLHPHVQPDFLRFLFNNRVGLVSCCQFNLIMNSSSSRPPSKSCREACRSDTGCACTYCPLY